MRDADVAGNLLGAEMMPQAKVTGIFHVSSLFGANFIPAGILWALPSLKSSSGCFRSQKVVQARDARAPLRHPGVGTARFTVPRVNSSTLQASLRQTALRSVSLQQL